MRGGSIAESRARQKIILTLMFVMFLAILISPGLDHRFEWSQVSAALVVVANLLMVAAFGFIVLVLRENPHLRSL
jgi:hypothetical protein